MIDEMLPGRSVGTPVLYCLPPAGAGASYYAPWRAMQNDWPFEIVAVQLPGRETRLAEPILTTMDQVVPEVIGQVTRSNVGPFALLGHSMGGAVAFETAAALPSSLADQCRGVIVSACSAPGEGLLRVAKSSATDIELIATLRRLGGTPEALLQNEAFMGMLIRILRADFALCESADTRRDVVIEYPLHVVGALDDVDVPERELRGWAERTSRDFNLTMVAEGGHHFVREETHARTILSLVRRLLVGTSTTVDRVSKDTLINNHVY